MGLLRLRIVTEAAAQLRIPQVTLCTGTRDRENMWQTHPDNRSHQAWADLLETMERALGIASQAGVTLAIEPEHANVVSDADRCSIPSPGPATGSRSSWTRPTCGRRTGPSTTSCRRRLTC